MPMVYKNYFFSSKTTDFISKMNVKDAYLAEPISILKSSSWKWWDKKITVRTVIQCSNYTNSELILVTRKSFHWVIEPHAFDREDTSKCRYSKANLWLCITVLVPKTKSMKWLTIYSWNKRLFSLNRKASWGSTMSDY